MNPVVATPSAESTDIVRNDRSTHFVFSHAIFQFPEARFTNGSDGTPSMSMRLGDLDVAMSFKTLRAEFDLDATPDHAMLETVASGLHHVKVIRPGDSIPREILDGTASWTIEDRHHELARGRLTLQISTWLAGDEKLILDEGSLLQLADDPATKARVQSAFSEIAQRLGLGPSGKEEVISRIESLARELAYIEALRERFGIVSGVRTKVKSFRVCYRGDRTFAEELQRIENLMARPFEELSSLFDQIDAQSGEIISLLRNIGNQISYIRKARDDLHQRMMLWDDIVLEWDSVVVERSTANEKIVNGLYRFIARNFNVAKAWQLTLGGGHQREPATIEGS